MGEPLLKNEDMHKIREQFNRWNLPEDLFGSVVSKIENVVKSGIMKLDDAIKSILGKDSLSESIKRDLYNWQYETEAKKSDAFTGSVNIPMAKQKEIIDSAFTIDPDEEEWGKVQSTKKSDFVPIEYDPIKIQPRDKKYAKTVTYMQILLQELGYLKKPDYGFLDKDTWDAYVAYATDHNLYSNKAWKRQVTPDVLKKMAEDADKK